MKHRNIAEILTLIAILVTLSVTVYYYGEHFEFLSIFVEDALWASVLATVVLIAINAIYAHQTRQTIKEMEKARKAEFIPHIRVEISWLGPAYLVLKATNFGKGPATNIRAEITFLPSKEKRLWEQVIMSPSEFIRIFLPEGEMEKVCEKSEKITVKGEYQDLFGQVFQIDETLDAKLFIEHGKQLKQLVERELPRLVEGIKDELGRIEQELRDIRREMERIRLHRERTE